MTSPDVHTAPLSKVLSRNVPSVNSNQDATTVIGMATASGAITSVVYVPVDALRVTGGPNTRTVSLINRGSDGTGTAAAALLTLSPEVSNNAAAADIPLSETATDLKVAPGDVLVWVSTHIAGGIADPGGLVQITLMRG